MLSWLGFGKKAKQASAEKSTAESSTEHLPDAKLAPAPVVEPLVEPISEPTSEQAAEPEKIVPVVNDASSVEHESGEEQKVEHGINVAEPVADVVDSIITLADEVLPEEKLLAEMTASEQGEETAAAEPANESVPNETVPVDSTTTLEPSDIKTLVGQDEAKTEAKTETKAAAKLGFFARLKQGLSKTRQNLGGGLIDLFRGKQIDDDLFEELETHLLLADVGIETTMKIIDSLTKSASRKQLKDASALYDLLKIELKKIIADVSQPLVIPESDGPFVILMVGVNGVGKTTTIGKLAKQFQAEGKSVMLAAGDTFRAAAVEQLQVWGERNNVPVIAQHTGADSASVIFDAISAAKARKVDVLIADTAGRLQNKAHLMEELKKIVRVMKKLDINAPHEVMLTLDAGTGQNALSQTKLFDEAVGLTGLIVTKLDGTAKGGVLFAIADKHNIPIRYLGVGEGIDDLRPFNGDDFIEALFSK
ncbi:signal recognition particle-docking protein FtsY [Colwellia sp. MT41]|uniref:signal recognition particle-docking protein FtsY n=1 Tax=Colwellia sp. MT41 TaxID=58049 RepID=UPI0007179355|nr:signal recognition particle-docking protein FtsY [Colwellia sp. MT41]